MGVCVCAQQSAQRTVGEMTLGTEGSHISSAASLLFLRQDEGDAYSSEEG